MAKTPKSADKVEGEGGDADPAPATMAGAPGEKVRVHGPEDGRWRSGIQFGPTEVEIDLGEITAEAFAEIEADPYLELRTVTPAPQPAPEQSPA